ncbi:hypothetical protein RHGRI_020279 [Rhododendron griersonianum]|uniref:F-box domain-containing protein n=1 Tax=Rhododendron griersonianum TaxID=479676 RepID=A0AAV6JN36_9ERIC|nr:hypothetical protein RHGRI_020279 [Rhododendron griersonianum]
MAQHHQAPCDDILINIFRRLSLESVSISKSVSKRWNCLLSAPSFLPIQIHEIHEPPPHGGFRERFDATESIRLFSGLNMARGNQ